MNIELIAKLVFLITLANSTPVLVRWIMGERWDWPADNYVVLSDGRRLLGDSKTVRGLISAAVITSLAGPLVGLSWKMGLIIAALSMVGDVISSFAKRRRGLPSGGRWTFIDQVPESLFPALAAMPLLGASVIDAIIVTAVFFIGQKLVSPWLHRFAIRQQPH